MPFFLGQNQKLTVLDEVDAICAVKLNKYSPDSEKTIRLDGVPSDIPDAPTGVLNVRAYAVLAAAAVTSAVIARLAWPSSRII